MRPFDDETFRRNTVFMMLSHNRKISRDSKNVSKQITVIIALRFRLYVPAVANDIHVRPLSSANTTKTPHITLG